VQSVATIATGEPLYRYDMAPTHRMGLIRCPYSLHQKTGLPVWPLTSEEITTLQETLEDGIFMDNYGLVGPRSSDIAYE